MKVAVKHFFIVVLLNLYVFVATAQTKFTATISPSVIGKNDYAELRLIVENAADVQQIIPPSLKNFDVVSGPVQESRMEMINGVTRQYTGISFTLKPKSKGNFTIGPATAKADGKTLQSNSISIQVTNDATVNNQRNNPFSPFGNAPDFDPQPTEIPFKDLILKKGENIQEKINKNIFVRAEVDKQSCFVGEPVTVTYKLYTRLKSESGLTKNPSFNGFSVIDLMPPGNSFYNVEKFNGRDYNVYTLRKSQLYPLEAGEIELESAEVDNNIHFIKEEYAKANAADLVNGFMLSSIPSEGLEIQRITLKSKPVILHVKPLPENGKPASFAGAVGRFDIAAIIDKNNFSTDDAGKLIINIQGEGNMTLINAPDIQWPDSIDAFEPKLTDQLDKATVPVSGNKYFEYSFTVSKPGKYTLPALALSFFDVKKGSYQTVYSKPISITVTKGTGRSASLLNNVNVQTEKEQFFNTLFSNRLMIIIPVALLILIGLFIWIRKDNKKQKIAETNIEKEESAVAVEEIIIPENALAKTQEYLLLHDKSFYTSLNKEFRQFLAKKLSIPLEQVNKKRIVEEADKKGIAVNTTLQIQQLLDDIEWQLYTPFSTDDKMQELFERADVLVKIISANDKNEH